MPAIDVTLSDGDVAVDVQANVGYSDAQARNALDGETITPGQVGTESDPVDESHTTVQHSQELSISDSTAVTGGPVGNEGEYIPVWSGHFNADQLTTTSQTYQRVTSSANEQIVPHSKFSLTNVSGYYINFSGIITNDTNNSVSVRLGRTTGDFPDTEIQTDGSYTRATGPLAAYNGGLDGNISVLMKCGGGTATVRASAATVWGKIA